MSLNEPDDIALQEVEEQAEAIGAPIDSVFDEYLDPLTELVARAFQSSLDLFYELWTPPTVTLVAAGVVEASAAAELAMEAGLSVAEDLLLDVYRAGALQAWIEHPRPVNPDTWTDLVSHNASTFLKSADRRVTSVSGNAWRSVRKAINEGQQKGLSLEEISANIENLVNTDLQSYQARRIAQTELTHAYNRAFDESMRSFDIKPTLKEWVAVMDDATRETHADANGQRVKLDEPFMVGSSLMPYPGEGPPEEVINCRCHVVYYHD